MNALSLTLSCLLASGFLPQNTEPGWQSMSNKRGLNKRQPLLLIDTPTSSEQPRRFLSMADVPTDTALMQQLQHITLSGSAQPTKAQIEQLHKHIGTPAILVDCREESKAFINGTPFTWYGQANADNQFLTPDKIQTKEQQQRHTLNQQGFAALHRLANKPNQKKNGLIYHTECRAVRIKSLVDEEQIAHNANVEYHRFYVTDHHPPNNETVDQFIVFF